MEEGNVKKEKHQSGGGGCVCAEGARTLRIQAYCYLGVVRPLFYFLGTSLWDALVLQGFCAKHQKLHDLNNRSVSSPSSGGWMSEFKVLAGLIPSEGCEGRICSTPLSLACRWLSSAVSPNLVSFLCTYLCVPFYKKTPVILD